MVGCVIETPFLEMGGGLLGVGKGEASGGLTCGPGCSRHRPYEGEGKGELKRAGWVWRIVISVSPSGDGGAKHLQVSVDWDPEGLLQMLRPYTIYRESPRCGLRIRSFVSFAALGARCVFVEKKSNRNECIFQQKPGNCGLQGW
ncbi:MAG: hypothetical protein CVU39_21015 [Chloroflexi bacterium HGW-Chloroflexi-10]|nr:MAG: hypothetical protein CVU39_21015 [Chloroflexi bacterium HGW-Chloroflexi-10]